MKSFTTLAILIAATPALLASPSMKAPACTSSSMPLNVVLANNDTTIGVLEIVGGVVGVLIGVLTLSGSSK